MSINNTKDNILGTVLKDKKARTDSPILSKIESGIYRAITTGQPDPEGRGRVAAFIPKLGGDPDNPLFFQYASPFGGQNGQGSYGMFAVPPDAGVTLLVFFADNGEVSDGYWFASTQETYDIVAGGVSGQAAADGTGQGEGAFANVPAAKANPTELTTLQGGQGAEPNSSSNNNGFGTDPLGEFGGVMPTATDVGLDAFGGAGAPIDDGYSEDTSEVETPNEADEQEETEVEEGNENPNDESTSGMDPDAGDPRQEAARTSRTHPNSSRNVNTAAQGVYSDSVRGQSTANPRRDANYQQPQHNRVYGIKTPGSNALTMDDGSIGDDGTVHPNQIRLQTGSGASVVLDGTNDVIYMINSTGSGWVEIGAGGEIMAYAQGSISMRAEKDFNIRADQNVNIEAADKINIKSGNNFALNSGNQAHFKSEGSQFFDSGSANHTKVATNMYVSTGGLLHLNGPQAAMSPALSTVSHPDIQSLASTQVDESIVSNMPSHEPMMRPKPAPTSSGGMPNTPASTPVPDPSSAAGQAEAVGQDGPPPELDDAEGLATIRSRSGASCQVAAVFQSNFQGLIDDLEARGYAVRMLGGYCNRNARGSTRPSYHAMGAAIDINWDTNGYGSRPAGWHGPTSRDGYKCDLPLDISAIAARHGLGWGGNWSNPWDPMHFSAGSGERGAYRFARTYSVVKSADITGTTSVRQWTG